MDGHATDVDARVETLVAGVLIESSMDRAERPFATGLESVLGVRESSEVEPVSDLVVFGDVAIDSQAP